jgi:hypothetical protein
MRTSADLYRQLERLMTIEEESPERFKVAI